jgi:hypothetical protein
VDPLRPFLSLVRSLWTSTATGKTAARRQTTATSPSSGQAMAIAASRPIEQRLQSQLAPLIRLWNAQRAREIFVGQVLLHELGEQLAADPAFAELIQRVSSQLGNDPRISARLDDLLRQLAAGS